MIKPKEPPATWPFVGLLKIFLPLPSLKRRCAPCLAPTSARIGTLLDVRSRSFACERIGGADLFEPVRYVVEERKARLPLGLNKMKGGCV